jgi:hypothetical protein
MAFVKVQVVICTEQDLTSTMKLRNVSSLDYAHAISDYTLFKAVSRRI